MNQEQVIALAREAGILEPIDLLPSNQWRQDTIRELERFAALVEQRVRSEIALEELAKISQELGDY
jgi:hypothetical protein